MSSMKSRRGVWPGLGWGHKKVYSFKTNIMTLIIQGNVGPLIAESSSSL